MIDLLIFAAIIGAVFALLGVLFVQRNGKTLLPYPYALNKHCLWQKGVPYHGYHRELARYSWLAIAMGFYLGVCFGIGFGSLL